MIWIFQLAIKNKIDRQEAFRTLREDVFKKYIDKTTESISSCRNLYTVVANPGENNAALELAIQDLRKNIRELYFYFETYQVILTTNDKVAAKHKILKEKFEEWCSQGNDVKALISFMQNCKELLQNILNESLKYIYGIK